MSSMRRTLPFLPLIALTSASGAVQPVLPSQPTALAPLQASAGISSAIGDWQRLRRDGYAFADYARYLIANPGWPNEATIRGYAEKAMRPGEPPATVMALFQSTEPKTGNGWARLAESFLAVGRSTDALRAAREAWGSSDLADSDEALLFSRFANQWTAADHDRRIDALLFDKKTAGAQRMLPWASPARRPVFAARLALQGATGDAEALYAAVASRVTSDAGLMMDRARYLRERGQEQAARQLLARPHQFTERPANPERWFDMLVALGLGANADRQYQLAYDITRQLDDAFAPGADVSLKSYGVRDNYTTLAWVAGTNALRRLNRPIDAIGLFERYAHGGRSLQVTSKGYYWAGRSAAQAGRVADATRWFEKAAQYPELFYGQLALERLGRTVPPPAGLPALLATDAQRAAFHQKRLVLAVRALGSWGRRDDQALFIRALSEQLGSDADRVLASELAGQIGRPDLAVWTARSARNSGSAFYFAPAFPVHSGNRVAGGRFWSLVHGITRQESSFDRTAMSGAGARGMMQLMTGTAREQADKMGVSYEYSRLTSDPAYNVMLGSAYFQRMVDRWGGSYPLAVASYNAGPGNVAKWVRQFGDPRRGEIDILDFIEAIPFSETKGYVQRVLENAVVYDQLNPSRIQPTPVHLSYYLGKTSRPG